MSGSSEKSSSKVPFFIVNLKPDLSIDDVVAFLNKITENGQRTFRNFYVALPYHHLKEATAQFADSGITFGASMLNRVDAGSFTAPIAVSMQKDAGAKFVLIGTREERELFQVNNEKVAEKVKKAFAEDLRPIVCIGESIEDFHAGKSKEVLAEQLKSALNDAPNTPLIIVYQMPFEALQDYLPSLHELKSAYLLCNEALELPQEISWAISLPIDLAGFSEVTENTPFDGYFFTKSGIFPHVIHQEATKLFHVHCLD